MVRTPSAVRPPEPTGGANSRGPVAGTSAGKPLVVAGGLSGAGELADSPPNRVAGDSLAGIAGWATLGSNAAAGIAAASPGTGGVLMTAGGAMTGVDGSPAKPEGGAAIASIRGTAAANGGAAGRVAAVKYMSRTCSPLAIARPTCCPGAMAVSAWATSSALRSGMPLIPRTSSPGRIPAAAAGPTGATVSTIHRPGTADSATASPSQPCPAAGAGGGTTVDSTRGPIGVSWSAPGAGPAMPDMAGAGSPNTGTGVEVGVFNRGPANGKAIGSPIEMSPGSKVGAPEASSPCALDALRPLAPAVIRAATIAAQRHRDCNSRGGIGSVMLGIAG